MYTQIGRLTYVKYIKLNKCLLYISDPNWIPDGSKQKYNWMHITEL